MMRGWIQASLTATLLCAASAAAAADETPLPNYEGRLLRRHEEQSRKARADELRFERARRRAEHRYALEEMYERMGYSPLRPATPYGTYGAAAFSGPYSYRAYYSYGGRPAGW